MLPKGTKGTKGKRAVTDLDSDSESSDSGSNKQPCKMKKTSRHNRGAPDNDNRPQCIGCGKHGHYLTDCRAVIAMTGALRAGALRAGGGDGNNTNGGRKPDRRPTNA